MTAEQLRALFGCGLYPLAELRQQQLEGPDLTLLEFQHASRLGLPFNIVDNDLILAGLSPLSQHVTASGAASCDESPGLAG